MKLNIKKTCRIIKKQWYHLVLLEVIYKFIFFFLILPLISLGFNFALRLTKYSYLTTENLFRFMKYPHTILIMLLVFVVVAILIHIETASLFFLFEDCKNEKPIYTIQLMVAGVRSILSSLRRKEFFLPVYAFAMFFFLNLPTLILIITNQGISSYLLKSFLAVEHIKPTLLVLILILFFCFNRRMFILPICILDKKTYREAKRISILYIREMKQNITSQILLVNMFLIVLYIVFYFICLTLLVLGINQFSDKRIAIPLFLQNYEQLKNIIFVCISVLTTVVNYCFISNLYTRMHKPQIKEFDDTIEMNHKKPKLKLRDNIKRKLKIAVVICVGLCAVTAYSYFYNMFRNGIFRAEESLLGLQISAHRGDSKEAPENTLAAIQSAIDCYADYAEIDVQLTKDGEVVLCHDSTLYRTAGVRKKVSDLTYAELLQYDVGAWFSDDFIGTRIPTLVEVLELTKGKIKLNIELKRIPKQRQLVEKVIALVEQYEFERQCVITSMSYEALRMVKELDDTIKTGYIMSLAYGNFYENNTIDFFSMKASIVNEEVVEKAHTLGKEVHCWTVNEKNEITRLSALGVDNIITDRPVYAQQVLYDVEKTSLLQYVKMIMN